MIIAILWLLLGAPVPPPIESHTSPPIDVKAGDMIVVAQLSFPDPPARQTTTPNEWKAPVRRRGTLHAPSLYGSGKYRTRSGAGAAPIVLNDSALTPGAIRTASRNDICSRRTDSIRNVTAATKRAVFAAYGIDCGKSCGKKYEVDHLISLEIGGSNAIENLWPQPYDAPGARQKDVLENKLHRMICVGTIAPAQAQKEISDDWWEAYWHYVRKADASLPR